MRGGRPGERHDTTRTTYRVIQKGLTVNEPGTDVDSLVTHHPSDNKNARMDDGVIVRGEAGRRHAYVGGEIQEIESAFAAESTILPAALYALPLMTSTSSVKRPLI